MYGLFDRGATRVMRFALVVLFALAAIGMGGRAAAADASEVNAPDKGGKRFAVVWRLSGDVSATMGAAGKPRKLRQGDPVLVGETLRAAASAEAVLRTEDAGWIAVRPGAVFVAERFVADGRASDEFVVRIVTGALRMITGWIGHSNRDGHRVTTPTATIGIRGTDHEPYVMTLELGEALGQTAGTYDKVNRGGTTLEARGNRLDVEPGKVGFARSPALPKTRALMSLLLPVLLDKVPAFYLPGQFDAELDQLSQASEEESRRHLEERRKAMPAPAVDAVAQGARAPAISSPASSAPAKPNGVTQPDACGATRVARNWLLQFDAGVAKRRSDAILRLVAPEFTVRATVRGQDASTTALELGRDEFAQSVVAALQGLTDFRQRRLSVQGRPIEPGACDRIEIISVVIEQGKRNGAAYRLESIESYVLEKRAGKWLAIRAETTQR